MVRGTWEAGCTVSASRHSLTHSLTSLGFFILPELIVQSGVNLVNKFTQPGFM